MRLPVERRSPYPGLQPFFVDDLAFFSGRARDVRLVVASLFASPLTLLYGPSGVGKSSVLHAGVLPRLAERRNVVVVSVRDWSDDPVRSIGEAAARAAGTEFGGDLGSVLETCSGDERRRVMLVLDQFEHALAERDEALVERLSAALLRPGLRVSALIAIREDALAELDRFDGRLPGLFDTVLRLEYLDRAAGEDAIRRPLVAWEQAAGEHVEADDELVEAVLDAVPAGRAANGIETAQLQLVMARVWEAERAAGSSRLRRETFVALGGADGIVRTHVRDALDGMAAADRELAAMVLDRLVTPSGARIAHLTDDLARYAGSDAATLRPVLERLATARVLRPVASAGAGGPRFEVYHELLADAVLAWLTDHAADRRAAIASARLRKRVLSLIAVAAIAAVVAVVLAGALVAEQRSSEEARSRAASATARRLLASGGDPQLALALALRAVRPRPTREAEIALRAALAGSHERAVLRGRGAGVVSVEVSRDGRALLVVEADGRARILDRAASRPSRALPGTGVVDAAFCPDDGSIAVAADGGATLVRPTATQRLSGDPVDAIACSAGATRVAIREIDRVRVFDARTGTVVAKLRVPSFDVQRQVALSSDGRRVAFPVPGGSTVVDLAGRRRRTSLRSRGGEPVTAVAFTPDRRGVVTGGGRGTVVRWDVARGSAVRELKGNESFVSSAAVGPDGTLIASGVSDGTARVWDAATGVQIAELRGHERYVTDVSFAGDGRTVATASEDGTVRLWEVPVRAVLRHGGDVASGAFAADGRRAMTATTGGTVELWDAPTGRRTARFRVPGVRSVAVAPDAGEIAIVEPSLRVRAWDPTRRKPPVALASAAEQVVSLAYRPDGREIALATGLGTIRVLDASGRTLRAFRNPELGSLDAVAFSPDGRRIAVTAAVENEIVLFDARSGRRIRRIPSPDDALASIAFSPDGARVIVGSPDGASIRDASTGRLRLRLRGHRAPVLSARFSAGGELVATASIDGEVRVSDATTGDLIATLAGSSAAFGGDRYILATGARLGARLYPCDACGSLETLHARGQGRVTRRFTDSQLKAAAGE